MIIVMLNNVFMFYLPRLSTSVSYGAEKKNHIIQITREITAITIYYFAVEKKVIGLPLKFFSKKQKKKKSILSSCVNSFAQIQKLNCLSLIYYYYFTK